MIKKYSKTITFKSKLDHCNSLVSRHELSWRTSTSSSILDIFKLYGILPGSRSNAAYYICHQHHQHRHHQVTVLSSRYLTHTSPSISQYSSCTQQRVIFVTKKSSFVKTRGQSNLTKSASWVAHSPVRGHPRGSKVVPLNSWGRVSY